MENGIPLSGGCSAGEELRDCRRDRVQGPSMTGTEKTFVAKIFKRLLNQQGTETVSLSLKNRVVGWTNLSLHGTMHREFLSRRMMLCYVMFSGKNPVDGVLPPRREPKVAPTRTTHAQT